MDGMKPGTRTHGAASLKLSYNTTVPAHLRGGLLELSHLETEPAKRRQGDASQLMADVCSEADADGKLLLLRPMPYEGGEMTQVQLADWYSRYGFDPIQLEPLLMARPPGAQMRFKVKPLVFTMAEAA